MKTILTTAILTAVLIIAPATAQDTNKEGAGDATGEIKEIIIKIQTPDGPRWYTLGADISKIDVRQGKVVRFNYSDDTIDSIEVEEAE